VFKNEIIMWRLSKLFQIINILNIIMTSFLYKLNLLDVVDDLEYVRFNLSDDSVKNLSQCTTERTMKQHNSIIIILIYLTIFFKKVIYDDSSVYDLILKQTESNPQIFIASSKGDFDFSKKQIHTELPHRNKMSTVDTYTYFEMRWFLSYLTAFLHGGSHQGSNKDCIQVHVFVLKQKQKRKQQVDENKPFTVRTDYDFAGYNSSIPNAFIFNKHVYDEGDLIHIACFKIYKCQDKFDSDMECIDILTKERVLFTLLHTPLHRSFDYNAKLFNYTYNVKQGPSQYNRKWRRNENIDACEICTLLFSRIKRKHHCRYCGKIICKGCSRRFRLQSWFEKNGLLYNIISERQSTPKLQRVCVRCFNRFDELERSTEVNKLKISTPALVEASLSVESSNVPVSGGAQKNKTLVYKTQKGYYYRRYKRGKTKRISKEMYYKLKKKSVRI